MDPLPASRRAQRLREIAQEIGAVTHDDATQLSPPRHVPSFRIPDDELKAGDLLAQLRTEDALSQPQSKGLKRAFTTTKKQGPYSCPELHAALTRVVDENGRAGVAEVLLNRFRGLHGDINVARRASTSVFKKITNAESQDQRGRLLQTATEQSRLDFVQLLSPFADASSLDESLFIALEKRNLGIIETLLRHQANTTRCQAQFQNGARHGDFETLGLFLRAPIRLPAQCITEALLPATRSGSLGAVLLLMRAGASGDHDGASALMCAVETGRVDLVAAIVMGPNFPSAVSLDRAIDVIFSDATAKLHDRLLLTEVLLCGGPNGNAANEGLFKATMLANEEMMQLLLEYRVDVNYNTASAVVHAIQRNRVDLLRHLLRDQSLKPELASEAVSRIPRTAPPPVKVAVLSMLLLHGASGTHCSELLITAAENDDTETARLLVCFGRDHNKPSVASVDYNAACCLQVAVSRDNHAMVDVLLEGHPLRFSLAKAFPLISKANEKRHFFMAKSLLDAGAAGDEVDAALRAAVTGQLQSKELIELLVRSGANVNGQTLLMAVSRGNLDILQILLMGCPSVVTCSAALTVAMRLHNPLTRFQIIRLLLPHATAADAEDTAVAQAVIHVLQNSPEDLELLRLLCQESKVNVNFHDGEAVALAIKCTNPLALEIVLQTTGALPTSATLARSLACAMELPLTDRHRQRKVESLLRRTKPQAAMDHALIQEIKLALSVKRDLSVVQTLLVAGADVNAEGAAPVCLAVRDPAIMDLILARRPTPQSLSTAFPLAVTLQDPARYNLCEKLLKSGAAGEEVSRALFVAAKEGPPAIPFMRLLLPQADINYSEGLALRLVVRRVFLEGLDLLLTQRSVMPTMATKRRAFQEAMKIKGKKDRYTVTKKLLAAEIKGEILSDALMAAVNWSDLPLSELLLQFGASVEHKGGQAVLSAASSSDVEMLRLLVAGTHCPKPNLSTLTAGFAGAMALKERDGDTYHQILQALLGAGLRGEAVDAALVEAVKQGDVNLRLTELIYSSGASVEWNDGEAVDVAAQSASLATLALLLGACPSQNVLKRAYRSSLTILSIDQRYSAIELIMKAGKSIDKHVTSTILLAAQQHPPDRELIKLLLGFEVFDEGQSMAHAAKELDLETLALLVEAPKAGTFISSAFKDMMNTGSPWQSSRGLSVTKLMLERGAAGEAVGEALVDAVERCNNPADPFAREFLDLLLRSNPNVNYDRGAALQRATRQANLDFIQKLLPGATSETKAMALPYLFKSSADETSILQLIEAFTDSTDNERKLDIGFKHPDLALEPVLFMALRMFPRKTQVLKALLEMGFSPDQWHLWEADLEVGKEVLTILFWALYQPEKKISSANIALLIDSGANVNFTSKSHITPVILSVKSQRPDVLQKLISKGANVAVADNTGATPLSLASQVGNATVMGYLLEAGAEVDDGSLHDAARELRCDAMRVLIKYGHEVDFPSDRHDGRSALAELCLKAVDNSPCPDLLEEAIRCLVANDADITLRCVGGKTIFHYAFDSSDPLLILRALLKILWKVINKECYLYTDGHYTYSLTKYVEKGLSLGPQVQNQAVIQLLQRHRAEPVFWANSTDTPQPVDYCGAPQHIQDEVNRQRAREKRLLEQREDVLTQVELKRLLAIEESKILQIQTDEQIRRELEKARNTDRILENRADQNLRLETRTELERQRLARVRQIDEIAHLKEIGDVQVSTRQAIGQTKIEMDRTEHMLQIEYMEERIKKENEGVRERLAIEGSGMEERDQLLRKQHEREMSRLKTQKTLVDSTTALANNLRSAGANQRQIGYIMGEV